MVADKISAFGRELREGVAPVVDFVYPPRCPVCGSATLDQRGLCAQCWAGLEIPGQPACSSCQIPIEIEDAALCKACSVAPPSHDGIVAATFYNDVSRQLVLALKHGRRIALAPMMARLIAARLPASDPPAILVPVPLHRWRLWKRGFNQAALIAKELSRLNRGELCVDGLVRVRRTPSLGGLGAAQRAEALHGSVRLGSAGEGRIAGRAVVLVDDVLTSGATSRECVRVLKAGGAQSVTIACFSRVLDAKW